MMPSSPPHVFSITKLETEIRKQRLGTSKQLCGDRRGRERLSESQPQPRGLWLCRIAPPESERATRALPTPHTPEVHLGGPPPSPEARSLPTFHGDRGHEPPGEVAPTSLTARPWQPSALQPSRPAPHSAAAGPPCAAHPGREAPSPLRPSPWPPGRPRPRSSATSAPPSAALPALGDCPVPWQIPLPLARTASQRKTGTAPFPGGPHFTLAVYGRRYLLGSLLECGPSVERKVGEQRGHRGGGERLSFCQTALGASKS